MLRKTFDCNDHKITEIDIIDSKNSSTAYVILYKLIGLWVLDSNRGVGVWSLQWCWHILSILLTAGRRISAETCGLDDVFSPDDLCSRPETLLILLSINMHSLHESCYRKINTYIRSVVQYWWSCTPPQSIGLLRECSVPVLNVTFCFFGWAIVSCSMINSLILAWLRPLIFFETTFWH